jgi:hypothetical protein
MKTKIVILSVLTIVVLPLGIGFTYHLGYARGAADVRLHWLVSYKDGVFTARENPAHRMLKSGNLGLVDSSVNVNAISGTSSPR